MLVALLKFKHSSLLLCALAFGLSSASLTPLQAQLPPTPAAEPEPTPQPAPMAEPGFLRQGTQVSLNGKLHNVAWGQWQSVGGQLAGEQASAANAVALGISDTGLVARLGVELDDSNDYRQQPVFWFSGQSLLLPTRFSTTGEYRYLEISRLARQGGWQMQLQGNVLQINTPPARITGLRVARQPWGMRLVLDLDRATPWYVSRLTNSRNGITPREFALTLEARLPPELASRLQTPAGGSISNLGFAVEDGRTVLRASLVGSLRPQVSMLDNPSRLILDFRAQSLVNRNILWAPGLRWREQTLALGNRQFPLTWLEVNPRQPGLSLQPIWVNRQSLVGIQPLAQIAQNWQAVAAINGGFFNRDRQLPLGAIRQNGQWISSPILNRGAIGWDSQGSLEVGRLSLQQSLVTGNGQRLAVAALDSGFVQRGIARYTRNWGASYTALSGNETVITVVNDQVTGQQRLGSGTPIPIPGNGYLLVLRDTEVPAGLGPGTTLDLQLQANPSEFERFPQILGAGPLLVEQGRVVLNAEAEQFGKGLDAQLAPRSAIGQTAEGTILLVTTHNRVGGAGPSLSEWAQVMQKLGAVDALNLDGGSSTALYLGGRLIDRHSVTTTRVQNGIGVFLKP